MCIIAIKYKNKKMFNQTTLENIFYSNPDGAGIMYPKNGKVQIEKGFMKYKEFKKAIQDLENKIDTFKVPVIIHARITTHGMTNKENCHPFIVSEDIEDLKRTKAQTDLAVVHNGVINLKPTSKFYSDTMQYIMEVLAPIKNDYADFLTSDAIKKTIEMSIGSSKLAFMDGEGNITTIGKFINDGGYSYSNSSYLSHYGWKRFTDYEWDKKSDEKEDKYYFDDFGAYGLCDDYDSIERVNMATDSQCFNVNDNSDIIYNLNEDYCFDEYNNLYKKNGEYYDFVDFGYIYKLDGNEVEFDILNVEEVKVRYF